MYSEQYDESIDVYAFGMCLLEMATGEYPYQECTKPFEIYRRVTQGIRPENYYRIDNSDLKELIDLCIRLKKSQRPTVKELVNHSWFMDSNGLNLELHRDEKTKKIFYTNESQVLFRLKLIDKSKHKNWPDNEAIEFIFDVDNDNPENIVKDLKVS
jgi:WNK lysine deficient protein kinase